tara:strand:+ start:117 stop:398 length:282 start_codon:yes stop_codon:yes gene_type:complete
MTKRESKQNEINDDDPQLSKALRESRNNTDCCNGSHAKWIDEVGKSVMLDEICDPEPLTGYTLIDEIEFTLYAAQAELNRLQKLIFLYKEQQE